MLRYKCKKKKKSNKGIAKSNNFCSQKDLELTSYILACVLFRIFIFALYLDKNWTKMTEFRILNSYCCWYWWWFLKKINKETVNTIRKFLMPFMESYHHWHGRCQEATYCILYVCEKKHFIICHIPNWFSIFCGYMHELKPLRCEWNRNEKKYTAQKLGSNAWYKIKNVLGWNLLTK